MKTPERKDSCGNFFISTRQQAGKSHRFMAFRARCKSWDCPVCRKIKAAEYRKRVGRFFDGRQLHLYTFTYYHQQDILSAWSTYNEAWNRFKTAARKKHGTFEYVRVLESHNESPYPHLHIITDIKFTDVWWQKEATKAGFGWQNVRKTVTSEGAKFYISKYLTKEWTNAEGKEYRKRCRCRLISFSSGVLFAKTGGGAWLALARCLDFDAACLTIEAFIDFEIKARTKTTHQDTKEDYYELTVYECE